MNFFTREYPVNYVCTCGEVKPLSKIYFCRYCSAIRCGFCVSHEVDARYCPVCLENLPVAEAWMKNNCCSSCNNCPICQLNLTTKVTVIKNKEVSETSEKEDGKSDTKKLYYLYCFGCHWTSRDVGIPDQTTSSATWPEYENPHTERINELMEYYKALSLNDKIISEKKQPTTRRNYSHLTGMSAAMLRRKVGFSTYPPGPFSIPGLQEVRKPPKIDPSVPKSEVNDLPQNIFTEVPNLINVSTLEQRFSTTCLQSANTSDLRPYRKLLLTKRSQRCRECDHNVTKPEFNPSSLKFKLLLAAYNHIPGVYIKKCNPLAPGKESDLVIHLINPTLHQITILFRPFESKEQSPAESTEPEEESEASLDDTNQKTKKVPVKVDNLTKIPPRPVNVLFTGIPILPECSVTLPSLDDVAEYDDETENQDFNDDQKVVIWRKGNQAAVKFSVKPNSDLEKGSAVVVGFIMNHTYINTMIQDKNQQKLNHDVKLILTVGKIA